MQAIALENNLSETAFLLPGRDPVPLRWFTPRAEVKLCGHATLATGHVLLNELEPGREQVTFETRSGPLRVRRARADDAGGGLLEMDFPAIGSRAVEPGTVPEAVLEGLRLDRLGVRPDEVRFTADDWNYLVVLPDRSAVAGVRPDFSRLEDVHPHGVAITAAAEEEDVDFVSRYFVPGYGVPEDPVTGSLHCALTPYWARRLGRDELTAAQLSARGGRLRVVHAGERVLLRGRVLPYLEGTIAVP
jgi:PhzF family phenazine biosynthesis protein